MITATEKEEYELVSAFGRLRPGGDGTGDGLLREYPVYLDALRRWLNEENAWPAVMVLADLSSSPHVERE